MSTPAPAPAPSAVHWTQPGFEAIAEDDGHGDTCGPIIMLDYLHVYNGQPLDYAATDALRARLIADGLMGTSGGMTMGNIVIAMKNYYGIPTLKYVPWEDSGAALSALHPDIIAALENHQAVAMETHNAQALPGNQQGVFNHFILAFGIDSQLGYLVANGDLLSVLAGGRTNPEQAAVWVGWQDLVNAQISSYAIWPAIEALVLDATKPPVSTYFTANADGTWTCHVTNAVLRGGILNFYKTLAAGSFNGLSLLGLPLTSEIAIGSPKAGSTAQPTFQVFERGVLVYDPDRVIDNPPGAQGSIYFGHINRPEVEKILVPPTPPAPTPVPTLSLGVPTASETNGEVLVALPVTLGVK